MDRASATGFGVSVAGHVALLALLSLALVTATNHPVTPPAMEVSFVDEVGLTSASPQPSPEPAAQARAPEIGPVEALGARLQQVAAASHEQGGPRIFLRADHGLDYGRVMQVMGEINRAGLHKVALVSTAQSEGR